MFYVRILVLFIIKYINNENLYYTLFFLLSICEGIIEL